MNIESMKNIVVLKELPSNMVEEAIVILKPSINIEKMKEKKENVKVSTKANKISKDCIIKEAEAVVTEYISSLEKPKQLEQTNQKLVVKYNRIKAISVLFGIVGVFGIIINLI